MHEGDSQYAGPPEHSHTQVGKGCFSQGSAWVLPVSGPLPGSFDFKLGSVLPGSLGVGEGASA